MDQGFKVYGLSFKITDYKIYISLFELLQIEKCKVKNHILVFYPFQSLSNSNEYSENMQMNVAYYVITMSQSSTKNTLRYL